MKAAIDIQNAASMLPITRRCSARRGHALVPMVAPIASPTAIAAEMQFYLLAPLLVFLLPRRAISFLATKANVEKWEFRYTPHITFDTRSARFACLGSFLRTLCPSRFMGIYNFLLIGPHPEFESDIVDSTFADCTPGLLHFI
ncbi:hypothetical protein NKI51_27235 [Mesorhizobium australicum]